MKWIGMLTKILYSTLSSTEFVDIEHRATPKTGFGALKKWDRQQKQDGL